MTSPTDAPAGARPGAGAGAVRSAARNSAVGAVGAVTASAMGFLFAIVVGRTLGATTSGTFFSCVAIAMVLITVACAGAETGLLWALARDRAHGGRQSRQVLRYALLPVAVTSAVLAAAVWLAADPIAGLISDASTPQAPDMVRATAVAVLVGPLMLCLVQASRGLGNVLAFTAIQQVGVPALRVLLLVALVLVVSPSGTAVMGTWAAPLLLLLPVAGAVALRRSRPAPTTTPVPEQQDPDLGFRPFWRYSLLRSVGSTASMALTWLDVLIVAALASPATAGAYAAASRFAASGQLGLQAMRLGISPGLAAAFAREDHRTVRDLYNLSSQCATLISWPIFWVLALFAPTALSWFGDDFSQGSTALMILCVAMMLSVATGSVATVLLMSGHSGWATRNTVLALAATVVVGVLLVPSLGATGAAIGWTTGVVIENGLGLWLVWRRLGVRPDVATLALVMGATTAVSVGAAAVGFAVAGQSSLGVVVAVAVVVPASMGATYLLRGRLRLGLLRRPGGARPTADPQERP